MLSPLAVKLMLTDPTLGWSCYFGPAVAYQYRLQGPDKWAEARDTILTTWERIYYPLSKKRAEEMAERRRRAHGVMWWSKVFVAIVLVLVAACIMWFYRLYSRWFLDKYPCAPQR